MSNVLLSLVLCVAHHGVALPLPRARQVHSTFEYSNI